MGHLLRTSWMKDRTGKNQCLRCRLQTVHFSVSHNTEKGRGLLWRIRERHWFEKSSIWSTHGKSGTCESINEARQQAWAWPKHDSIWKGPFFPTFREHIMKLIYHMYPSYCICTLERNYKFFQSCFFVLTSFCQLPTLPVFEDQFVLSHSSV